MPGEIQLTCPSCNAVEFCGWPQMLARLQSIGMLKRSKDADPDLILQLLPSAAPRLSCARCGHQGLVARQAADDDWDMVVACANCGRPIERERLDALPGVTSCAACQRASESGRDEPREFCPRCGSEMRIQPGRGPGLTRYEMKCPSCRR